MMQLSHVVLGLYQWFDLLPATVPFRVFGGQTISLLAIKCLERAGLRMKFLSKRNSCCTEKNASPHAAAANPLSAEYLEPNSTYHRLFPIQMVLDF